MVSRNARGIEPGNMPAMDAAADFPCQRQHPGNSQGQRKIQERTVPVIRDGCNNQRNERDNQRNPACRRHRRGCQPTRPTLVPCERKKARSATSPEFPIQVAPFRVDTLCTYLSGVAASSVDLERAKPERRDRATCASPMSIANPHG